MALKSILNQQSDFTGEFPAAYAKDGLWRFNESAPDASIALQDSSGHDRHFAISGWSGTTAALVGGYAGKYFRFNTNAPATEKTYLKVENDGSIFENLGERIIVGGWIRPTTYSISNTYCPIFNTRQGPGMPILYLSLYNGKPRLMLYNASGALILDKSFTPAFTMAHNGWYFLAAVIEPGSKKAWMCLGDRATGSISVSDTLNMTGELNRSCTADIIMGMHAESYWYAGGIDDWFLDVDSTLTIQDLADYFRGACLANGGDTTGTVDAITEPGSVMLRYANGVYPTEGVLLTAPAACGISGAGRVSITSEYTAGITAVSLVETATSDDLVHWSGWRAIGADGRLISTARKYIRFRVTLTTTDGQKTPKLTGIRLYETPKQSYEKISYARPVVLDKNGAWEAVLENAYDTLVTSEINGEDTLSFRISFHDSKRIYIDSEKKIQLVDNVYIIRKITDTRSSSGSIVTEVYAEAEFYDLAVAGLREEKAFDAVTPEVPMAYALNNTDWSVGTVTVKTYRTWTNSEKNPLAMLRKIASIHGGDLVFDCPNHLVHLLTVHGKDSGAVFSYGKNMKDIERTVDTTGLITRLYATGANGMTFASINDGKPYVEDYTYSSELRVSALDCSSFSNPYQMKEFAEMRLAQYSRPSVAYVMKAMDLSAVTGYEHEAWELGDYVRVEDRELGISVTTRIVRRECPPEEPWNTVLELSTTLKNLGSSANQVDGAADSGGSADIGDMVPFNHLHNSRADDGLAYWVSSGFRAVGGVGVSGTASFRADGIEDMTLSLSQTVYPSSRSSYTISAQIASENLQRLAEDSQVGIEIIFEYEDGTTDTRFIDLY